MKGFPALTLVLLIGAALAGAACNPDNGDPFGEDTVDFDWPSGDPDRYHWDGISDPYFEFWEWHVAVPEESAAFSVTMGVANPGSDDPEARQAFVVFAGLGLDAPRVAVYSLRDLEASRQIGDLEIGEIRGTERVVRGSIESDPPISFDLRFEIDEAWEDTMGFLTNVPAMPTNWHVNALSASVSGEAVVGSTRVDLAGAPAMQDHFWGTDYPGVTLRVMAWNFEDPASSFAFFGGNLLLGPFKLPIIMLSYRRGDVRYEMITQNGNALGSFWEDDDGVWVIEATRGDVKLRATAMLFDGAAYSGLVFGGDGLNFGGRVRQDAVVNVDVIRRDDSGAWMPEATDTSPLGLWSQGVEDPYQQF